MSPRPITTAASRLVVLGVAHALSKGILLSAQRLGRCQWLRAEEEAECAAILECLRQAQVGLRVLVEKLKDPASARGESSTQYPPINRDDMPYG